MTAPHPIPLPMGGEGRGEGVLYFEGTSNNFQFVTPAQAGVQLCQELMDSCFRRNDIFRGSLEFWIVEFGAYYTLCMIS